MAKPQLTQLPDGFELEEDDAQKAAQLPDGFELVPADQVSASSPSPTQASDGAMTVPGLPLLDQQPPESVRDAIKNYKPELPKQPDQSELPEGFALEDQLSAGKPKTFMDHLRGIFGKSDEEKQAEAANIYAIHKATGIPILEVEKNYDTLKKDSEITGMTHQAQTPGEVIGGVAKGLGEAGERYPRGLMKSVEDVQSGKKPDVLNNIFTPNPDHRDAMTIALDIGKKVLPEANIKNPESKLEYVTTVAKEFVKNLPFAIAGGVSEFTNPINQVVGAGISKLPNVNIPAPKWIDDAVHGVIQNFGAPFTSLNNAAKTKLTNSIVDEIYTKVEPRMDELKANFKDIYGREATVADIKGQIRSKLDEGLRQDNVAQLVKKLVQVKTAKPVLSKVEAPKALPGAKPVEPAQPAAKQPIDVEAVSKTPQESVVAKSPQKPPAIVEAEKHGTVVGLDAGTKLPIIDTTKPVPVSTKTDFTERRVQKTEGAPRNRLSDWTDVIDAYPTNEGKFYQISRLPVSDTIKGRLVDHYKLNQSSTPAKVEPVKEAPERYIEGRLHRLEGNQWIDVDKNPLPPKTPQPSNMKDVEVFQGRGKTRKEIYAQAQYPVIGDGQYYAFNEKDASRYGSNISKSKIDTTKMLEISNDEQWRSLNTEAGNKYTNPTGLSEEQSKQWSDNIKNLLLKKGHDGLVVNISEEGDAGKSLRNVFGHDQIVSYKTEAPNGQKESQPVQVSKTETVAKSPAGQGQVQDVKPVKIGNGQNLNLKFELPKFRNTEHALDFGKANKNNPQIVAKLKQAQADSEAKFDALAAKPTKTDADKQAMIDEATRGQLYREAVESAEGRANDVRDTLKAKKSNVDEQIKYSKPAETPKELGARIDQLNKFAQSQAILRRGANMKKAMGSFQGKGGKDAGPAGLVKLDQKTLLSDSDYVTTLSHELGHAIEHSVVGKTNNKNLKLFGDSIDQPTLKTLYNELLAVTEDIAPGGLKAKPEYYSKPAELIARFLEKMITSPSDLDAMAPTAVKMFEAQAQKHPIIAEFIGVAEDKLYNKKDLAKGLILPDLRETYQKELGSKRLGNIAFGNYVAYRAARERGKVQIEKFIKEKFKGIKDKPEDLFVAAEGIKVSRSGIPEFGTRSYVTARTPEEEVALKAQGYEKMPDPVWVDGTAYPEYAVWNFKPADAKANFEKLSPAGKQLILDFTAQRSEAKDYFNREMIQSANNIDRTIEGWVHHFWPGESSSTAVGGQRFKNKIAGTRKHRTGQTGYVQDLNAAITKAMTDLDGEKVWNDFITRHLAMVTRPLAEGQQPMKGWIEVQGDLKKGIGRPVERPKTVILDKATGESFKPKVSRYQMPAALYKHYELIKDLAEEASLPLRIVNYIQQYWQINTLFHAGTAATNFIGGGIMFTNKILHDMYLEGLTGDFKMPQTRQNIAAMFKVLMPHGWAKAPDWVYGNDLSNFYGQFMTKGIDPVQHGIDKVGDKALLAFGTIERYWKKVIMTSEGLSDVNKLAKVGPDGLKLPTKEEREMLAAINDTVDLYAFDYDNVSGALEQFRRNPVARGFKPYATYPYKYMKHIERLIRSIFDRNRSWQDRTATLLALATLMGGYAYYSAKRKEEQQTPVAPVESKIPARLQTRGRTFVGTTEDGKELFSRFGKYPYFGLSETGVQVATGNMEAGRDALNDVVGSLGPFANLTLLAFGYRNKYNQYDPVPVVVGDVVGGYLPGYRVMNDISRYFDPFQRKQETFGQAAFGRYVPTTDEDLQAKLHGKIRTEDVPIEGDIKGAKGRKTTIEYPLENNKEDILLSALTGVYRSRLDPKVVEAYLIREQKNKDKREKKKLKESK